MKRIISFKKIWVCLFLLQMLVQTVSAQENSISVDVQSTRSVVAVNNVLNTIEGADVTFRFNLNVEDSILRIETLTGIFAGNSCELASSLENGVLKIEDLTLDSLKASTDDKIFNLKIDYVIGDSVQEMVDGEEKMIWKESMKTIEIESQPIHVWPEIKEIKASGNDSAEILNGESVTFGVDVAGGYPEGWRLEWPDGSDGTSFEYVSTKVEKKTVENLIVKVSNIAPDNKTVWEYKELTFSVSVLPTPVCNIKGNSLLYASDGDNVTLQCEMSGGNPDGWTLSWMDGDKQLSGDNPFIYTVAAPKGKTQKKILLVAQNYGSDKAKLFFSDTIEYNIIAFPKADVALVGDSNIEMISGGKYTFEVNATGGNDEGWEYEWNHAGNKTPGKQIEYAAKQVSAKTTDQISVTAINYAPDHKVLFTKKLTADIVVWPILSADIVGNSNVVLQNGATHQFDVKISGGNPAGYEYLWKSSNQSSKEKSFSYKASTGNNVSTDKINVTVSNYSSGHKKLDEKSLSYNVEIWPSASSSIKSTSNENVFYEENITFEIVTSGGYTGEENGGWSFVWKRNGVVLSDQTTSICKDIVPNSDKSFEIYNYEVSVINKYGNEQWYSKSYTFSVMGWQKGSLIKVPEDSVDVYHGSPVVLKSRKDGGFDSGWAFSWKADGTVVDNNSNEYAFQAINTDNRDKIYQRHEYVLHASNKINNDIPGYECDLKYEIHVWPKCKFPSDININDETTSQIVSECIREGNTISLRVDDPLCGYWSESKSPWRYSWTKDDKVLGNDSKVVLGEKAVMGNGETKEIKTINYGLTIDNLGPNNHVWDSKKYKKAVSIYRKPATPTKLYKKGNGNSCTLIAESSISDDKLDDYEYFLVFGYTDPNGKEVSEMPVRQSEGTTRYDKISSSAFQNSNNRFWVYAMWQYEDGSQVTSGKCYLDGSVDEDFDGSVFKNNTRGFMDDESTAIEDVRCDVSVDNNAKCLNINQGCPSQVSVSVYNISGTLIRQDKFENVTSLAYRYDLPKGLYIINVKSSSIQTNKKVLIP